MNTVPCFVVSDLHLGSRHSAYRAFLSWLDTIPRGAALVLNGDVLDDPEQPLDDPENRVIRRLIAESFHRPVVWLPGNNDAEFPPADTGRIKFAGEWKIDNRLLIVHGDRFDITLEWMEILSIGKILESGLKWLFRRLTDLGYCHDKPMSQRARSWSFFYSYFNRYMARKATVFAAARGVGAIACGHTHQPMECIENNVRYLNTGSWTEAPFCYLMVEHDRICLRTFSPDNARADHSQRIETTDTPSADACRR